MPPVETITSVQDRVDELVGLLCGRPASSEELNAAARPHFSFAQFRLQLLLSDECVHRWPHVPQRLAELAEKRKEAASSAHKLAHDLSLLHRDLGAAQAKLDGLQQQMLDMVRQVDAIARVADTMRDVQTGILDLSAKAARLEERLGLIVAEDV